MSQKSNLIISDEDPLFLKYSNIFIKIGIIAKPIELSTINKSIDVPFQKDGQAYWQDYKFALSQKIGAIYKNKEWILDNPEFEDAFDDAVCELTDSVVTYTGE